MSQNQRKGAEILVDILYKEGVEYMFGYPGGKAIPIFDALIESPIKFILSRHEQGATHMADGYARSTGKPGVVLVTSGPGATNTITGIMTAQMDSVPIVILAGQQNTDCLGLDTFQEADMSGITYPLVKHSYLIKDPADIPRIIKEALHIATTGRPGPILVDLPGDITSAKVPDELNENFDLPGYNPLTHPDPSMIRQAAEMISAANRPLLMVGHGAIISGASKALNYFVEKMQIPVVNTLLGKGCFPETHSLNLGMPGMHGTAYANKALIDCDLIISVGARWDDRIASDPATFCKHARKIHIDIDASEINKVIPVDIGLVGDAKEILEQLTAVAIKGNTEAWIKHCDRLRKEFPLCYKKEGKLKPQHVVDEINRICNGKAIITTDVGQNQMWAAQFIKISQPRSWISSGGAGTMGFGFPASIGAQFGNPQKPVWLIAGDGGFQMTLCELATATLHKLPIKIVLLNNNYLGMVRQWQTLFWDNRLSGVDLEGNPNFVKLAEAYGCKGFRVKRSADLKKILNQAANYNEGPCLIDCEVAKVENVFPMIPAGQPLEAMLLCEPKSKKTNSTKKEKN